MLFVNSKNYVLKTEFSDLEKKCLLLQEAMNKRFKAVGAQSDFIGDQLDTIISRLDALESKDKIK